MVVCVIVVLVGCVRVFDSGVCIQWWWRNGGVCNGGVYVRLFSTMGVCVGVMVVCLRTGSMLV